MDRKGGAVVVWPPLALCNPRAVEEVRGARHIAVAIAVPRVHLELMGSQAPIPLKRIHAHLVSSVGGFWENHFPSTYIFFS